MRFSSEVPKEFKWWRRNFSNDHPITGNDKGHNNYYHILSGGVGILSKLNNSYVVLVDITNITWLYNDAANDDSNDTVYDDNDEFQKSSMNYKAWLYLGINIRYSRQFNV